MTSRIALVRLALCMMTLASCGGDDANGAPPFTLYRNSPLDPALRVHWGTFDANESDQSYNRNNCEMAARLLNANMIEFAKRSGELPHASVGFWCERGLFSEKGYNPSSFEADFPTDVPEPNRVP